MLKKILLTLMLSLTLCTLTGCANPFEDLNAMLTDMKDEAGDKSFLNKVKNGAWSADTQDLQMEWAELEGEEAKWANETKESYKPGFGGFIKAAVQGKGFTQKDQIEWYQNYYRGEANKKRAEAEASMMQDDMMRTEEDSEIPWPLIIGVGVAAIVILLILKFTQKPKPAPVVAPAPAQTTELVVSGDRMGFNREKSARRICKELGLNYENELAAVDGDLVKLMDVLYDKKGY